MQGGRDPIDEDVPGADMHQIKLKRTAQQTQLSYKPLSIWAQLARSGVRSQAFIPTSLMRRLSASVCSFVLSHKTSETDVCWRRGGRNQLSCAFVGKLRMVCICVIFAGLFQGPDSGHENERNEM